MVGSEKRFRKFVFCNRVLGPEKGIEPSKEGLSLFLYTVDSLIASSLSPAYSKGML